MKKLKLFLVLMLLVPVAVGFVGCAPKDPTYTTYEVASASQLTTAMSTIKSGDVIKLTDDIDITDEGWKIQNVELTLDLNGHDIYSINSDAGNILVGTGAKLILTDNSANKDGKIYSNTALDDEDINTNILKVIGGEMLMLGGNIEAIEENGQYGISVRDGGKFEMRGGEIKATSMAISGNGNNLKAGANTPETTDDVPYEATTIIITGGKIVSLKDYAIYQPQKGSMIINGGIIDGTAGAISVRRGTVVINGGRFATDGTGDVGEGSDGTTNLTNNLINVTGNYADKYDDVANVTIKDGEFVGSLILDNAYASVSSLKVEGGKFNLDPTPYLAEGYQVVDADSAFQVIPEV